MSGKSGVGPNSLGFKESLPGDSVELGIVDLLMSLEVSVVETLT